MNTGYDNGFKKVLRSILLYSAGEAPTVKEVAPLLAVSENMVYQYMSAEKPVNMPYEKARILSRYLIGEWNDRRIADWFDGEGKPYRLNGIIDDEVVDLDLVEGHIIETFRAGDFESALRMVSEAEAVLARLRAEISQQMKG